LQCRLMPTLKFHAVAKSVIAIRAAKGDRSGVQSLAAREDS
jgi:hypothetical protein